MPAGYEPGVAQTAASDLGGREGLDTAAAMQRLASQPARVQLGERLVGQLGARTAGMWLDQKADTVVVNVLDEQAAATVRAAGARARVVARSMARLEAIQAALTRAQPTDTAVGIDIEANQVVVQIGKAAAGNAGLAGLTTAADRFGDAVRVERVNGSFHTLISGGQPITEAGGYCSLGFNTTGNTGLTAGHCTQAIPHWYDGFTGQYYGPSIAASYPGNDFGLIRNDGALPQPGNVYLYNGSYQDVTRSAEPYPGLYLCKSGATTTVTCGYVYYVNVAVCYPDGCLDGLAASDAYAAPGDSGGPWFAGVHGIGLTSGGGGGWTFFQPVNEAVYAYRVKLY